MPRRPTTTYPDQVDTDHLTGLLKGLGISISDSHGGTAGGIVAKRGL